MWKVVLWYWIFTCMAAKQAMDMSGMTTRRLSYTWSLGKLETPNGIKSGKTVMHTTLHQTSQRRVGKYQQQK